ncbi:hypothetical protein L6452_19094 [Arctium lappa]|uniref:Uncharacterized protein n=1 Tax=Arctium lappa TaxID=4217 RepID=A0ACB9B716_ARCLA|nr:hypothetical protein L6452_19094 [Arctium lappa]
MLLRKYLLVTESQVSKCGFHIVKKKGDVLYLKRTKYSKYRKGRCSRGCKPDGTRLGFGRYGTKSCRAGRLSYRAIEAARRVIIGQFHRTMSGQSEEMKSEWEEEKGNPTGWIARVSTGQIPFEMDGVSLSNARQAATLAAHKLCSSTKFVQWSFASRYVVFPNVDGLELHIPEEKEMSAKKPLPDVDPKVTIQQRLFGVKGKRGTDRSDNKIKGQKLDWIKHQLWKLIRRWLEGKASALASKDCALVNEAEEKERSSSLKVRTKRKEQRRRGYNLAWESV